MEILFIIGGFFFNINKVIWELLNNMFREIGKLNVYKSLIIYYLVGMCIKEILYFINKCICVK